MLTVDTSSVIGAAVALGPGFAFGTAAAAAAERGRVELQLPRLLVGVVSAVLAAACFLRYGVSARAGIGRPCSSLAIVS